MCRHSTKKNPKPNAENKSNVIYSVLLVQSICTGRRSKIKIRKRDIPVPQINHFKLFLKVLENKFSYCLRLTSLFLFLSPGRSSSCYDNEIVMMNHVYKERFPKVRPVKTTSQSCSHSSDPAPADTTRGSSHSE